MFYVKSNIEILISTTRWYISTMIFKGERLRTSVYEKLCQYMNNVVFHFKSGKKIYSFIFLGISSIISSGISSASKRRGRDENNVSFQTI